VPQTVVSNPVSFTVENRTPPSFTIEGVKDGDRIVAGQQYNFIAQRNGNETIQWFRNGIAVSGIGPGGAQYSFTPAAADGEIGFAVRGTLNSTAAEKTFKVKVINPSISIVLPTNLAYNNLYPSGTAIPLQTERKDIDRVEWSVDNQAYAHPTVSFEPGSHRLSVRGFATGVRLPDARYGEYEALNGVTGRDITVAERAIIRSITVPATLYTGEALNMAVTTSGDRNGELIVSLAYNIDGKVYMQERAPVTKTATVADLSEGRHSLSVTLTDVFGNRSTSETSLTVY
jgi:hypothetical protein